MSSSRFLELLIYPNLVDTHKIYTQIYSQRQNTEYTESSPTSNIREFRISGGSNNWEYTVVVKYTTECGRSRINQLSLLQSTNLLVAPAQYGISKQKFNN